MDIFIKRVRDFYSPYYNGIDEAHRIDHADKVVETGLVINEELSLNLDIKLIILAGYIHDMYTQVDRVNHHNLAYIHTIKEVEKLWDISLMETLLIADAVKEHRASGSGNFSNILSEILSTADKGKPSLVEYVIRSYKYNKNKYYDDTAIYANILNHLQEKFGINGYAKYPQLYNKVFKDELIILKE